MNARFTLVTILALTAGVFAADEPITSIPSVPAAGTGQYLGNRAPLAPSPLMKLPPGAITPRGWLRHQLELDAAGLVGHLPEVSDFLKYEGNGWVDPNANVGWEELPYWLRGYGDLGYVLKDEAIIAAARKWIDGILANQRPDGYFGPLRLKTAERNQPDLWPHMLVLDALHSYYEYTGDERVPEFMLKYFRWQTNLPPEAYHVGWGSVRWADNMAIIYWLYNKTGEGWLLDLARKIHENSANYTTSIPTWHNVNLAQGIREPAEYWMQAKDPKFLDATEASYQRIMGTWGQFPGGGFAGDENIRKPFKDPRQGFETCGYVEFMHTFEMMTRITGRPIWSDRCEDIAFNSLPATMSPDHKGIHYITCANCIQLDNEKKGYQFDNRFAMLAYQPGIRQYRCCTHNYGMGWPYFTEELWLATADSGLCASLYAASEVKAKVAGGVEVTITEETDYPFGNTINLRIATPQAVTFPLYLRIPEWCDFASAKINGQPVEMEVAPCSYAPIRREWKNGDTVTLQLPMHLAVRRWPKNMNSASVNYGPLTFSLQIGEKWHQYAGTEQWPECEVQPTTPWDYGLVIDPKNPPASFKVTLPTGPLAENPFTPATVPIKIAAQARKIPGWQADRQNVVGVLRPGPVRSTEPVETITLIPMGAARLRITSFPVIGTGPDAKEWTAPPAATYRVSVSFSETDHPDALSESLEPSASSDESVPRFTWWPHKGSTEWAQYEFNQPTTVAQTSIYWFDDTGHGQCRLPKSWRLLYREGQEWKPVEATDPYGTAADRYNDVTFKPVKTDALRVEVQLPEGFCAGILNWKVSSGARE